MVCAIWMAREGGHLQAEASPPPSVPHTVFPGCRDPPTSSSLGWTQFAGLSVPRFSLEGLCLWIHDATFIPRHPLFFCTWIVHKLLLMSCAENTWGGHHPPSEGQRIVRKSCSAVSLSQPATYCPIPPHVLLHCPCS